MRVTCLSLETERPNLENIMDRASVCNAKSLYSEYSRELFTARSLEPSE